MSKLYLFYQRAFSGGWVPATSPTHPSTHTRDGQKVIFAGVVELPEKDWGLPLDMLSRLYPLSLSGKTP